MSAQFLYQRGHGALRRVMHLTSFNPRTGEPTMRPFCGMTRDFNTTCNLPLGQRICKRCRAAWEDES